MVALSAAATASGQTVGAFPDPGPGGQAPRSAASDPPPAAPEPAPSAPSPSPPAPPGAAVPATPPPGSTSTTSAPAPTLSGETGTLSDPWVLPAASSGRPFLPTLLPYRNGDPVPPGYEVESQAASGLITAGMVTLMLGYVAGAGVAAANDFENGTGWLLVPVVGPWGAMGARTLSCNPDEFEQSACTEAAVDELTMFAFLAVDGLVQATGTALLLAGVLSREHWLVRTDRTGAAQIVVSPPRVAVDRRGARLELGAVF